MISNEGGGLGGSYSSYKYGMPTVPRVLYHQDRCHFPDLFAGPKVSLIDTYTMKYSAWRGLTY